MSEPLIISKSAQLGRFRLLFRCIRHVLVRHVRHKLFPLWPSEPRLVSYGRFWAFTEQINMHVSDGIVTDARVPHVIRPVEDH